MSQISTIYNKTANFINTHFKLIIILLFIITTLTSIIKLDEIPYGLHVDEAGMAYDAYSISKFGVDRYLNKYPVYLTNYGGGQSAMYAYIAAFFITIFGYSTKIIRLPAVILRLTMFISGLFIIKNEDNKKLELIFLFLFTISPYFIMQSRWGLDCNLLVGFLTISVCLLIQAIYKNKTSLLFLSGVFFGLTLYTYALSYIIVPLILLFVCIYLLYTKKLDFKKLVIFGIPIFLLALPLILMILVNNNIIPEIKGFITIPVLKDYRGAEISLSNIIKNAYIFLSILSFDNPCVFGKMLIYNSIPYFGTIYYFAIPFFVIGFIHCIKNFYHSVKNKEFNVNIVFVFWFISVIICMLLIVQPNINKANAIFIPLTYFTAQGIVYITKKYKWTLIPILLIFIIHFALFCYYYFFNYNNDNMEQPLFATYYLDAIEYSNTLDKETIYIEENMASQEYIYVLLTNLVSPYDYATDNITVTRDNSINTVYCFSIPEKITDTNAAYIVKNNGDLYNELKNLDFSEEQFGIFTIFY